MNTNDLNVTDQGQGLLDENESVDNTTLSPVLQDIIDNQAVSDPAFYCLIVLYALVIVGSVAGNVLVITAVLKSPNMRKVNNILIVNLAISDLLLCTVVSPGTLVEILAKRWIFPKLQWLCHISAMGPVCITFVSTLTITGIAIDRYKVIVYSANNRTPEKASRALLKVLLVWGLAVLLSFPLFFAMNLKVITMPPPVVEIIGDDSIAYCAEEWGEYEKGRLIFSCFSFLVQFILPITLISFAHHAIKKKLSNLPSWQKTSSHETKATKEPKAPKVGEQVEANDDDVGKDKDNQNGVADVIEMVPLAPAAAAGKAEDPVIQIQNNRLREKIKKQSRTHALLVSIVVVFALSWFPLNVLNIVLDIHNIFESEEASRICFAFCHLIGMSSAFSNPILYGWFNEAFRDEFKNIFRALMCWKKSSPSENEAQVAANQGQPNGIIAKKPSRKICTNVKLHVDQVEVIVDPAAVKVMDKVQQV